MIAYAQINKWLLPWRESDPGLTRLRQALRTTTAAIAAPLVIWYLQHWQPALSGIAPLSIAFLTGMLMIMTTFGETRRIQKQSFILAGGTGLLMVLLESMIHHSYLLEVTVFMLITFIVFYIRRFGVRYTGISIYAMTIFLMSTVMNAHKNTWHGLIGGVSIGVGVTYIINFYLLPNTPLKTFLDSIPPFLRKSSQVLDNLEALLLGNVPPAQSGKLLHDTMQDLQHTILVSENLLSNLRIDTQTGKAPFRKCGLDQYRISSTLLIVGDHLQHAVSHHGLPSPDIQQPVYQAIRNIRIALLSLADNEGNVKSWAESVNRLQQQLDHLIEFLEDTEVRDSFRLFYILRTVFSLKRILDAADELNQNWAKARHLL